MEFRCVKGSKVLGVRKGKIYDALIGDHTSGHDLKLIMSVGSVSKTFYVPSVHKNKVKRKEEFNVNRGNPTIKARFVLL